MIKLHILNVGHGDTIIIEFPSGRLTVVDINRSVEMDNDSFNEVLSNYDSTKALIARLMYKKNSIKYSELLKQAGYDISLTDPIYYIKNLGYQRPIFRFISTHPHMDHLTGLYDLFNEIGFTNAWILTNDFAQDVSQLSESQKIDWRFYQQMRDNRFDGLTVVRPIEKHQNKFWMQDGIYILAPNSNILQKAEKHNDISYVLLIKYGATKIVLGSDAENMTWAYIAENYPDAISNLTVLKASHHGRDSGYHQEAVKIMKPKCTVVSVGKKPETDASQKYSQYSELVLSTRWYGTISFELDEQGGGTYNTEFSRI